MLFYFIAMRPYIENAVGDKMYLALDDAVAACEWINDRIPPYSFQVFEAEAVNIKPSGLTSVPVDGCADQVAPISDVERGAAATEHHR